jgi:hypothetical protein
VAVGAAGVGAFEGAVAVDGVGALNGGASRGGAAVALQSAVLEGPARVEDVEEAAEDLVGAEEATLGGVVLGVIRELDDGGAADGFAFEEVGDGLEDLGFAGGEGGVGLALADDGGEVLAGGGGGAGFLAAGFEFAEVGFDPGGGSDVRRER